MYISLKINNDQHYLVIKWYYTSKHVSSKHVHYNFIKFVFLAFGFRIRGWRGRGGGLELLYMCFIIHNAKILLMYCSILNRSISIIFLSLHINWPFLPIFLRAIIFELQTESICSLISIRNNWKFLFLSILNYLHKTRNWCIFLGLLL